MRLRRHATEIGRAPTTPPALPSAPMVDERYVREAPSAQLAVDLFKGEWSTALPADVGAVAGTALLTVDPRIDWIVEQAGGVDGLDVLELGPLEGGHTFMLERAGASVTAIESNTRAFVRCLIAKELLNLRNARFMLGDFVPFMETTDRRFDLVLASGVLYHAPDPPRMLAAIARVTDRVAIWTHYFDPSLMQSAVEVARFMTDVDTVEFGGRSVNLHRRNYLELRDSPAYCGGPESSAVWLEPDDLQHVLRTLGFDRIVIGYIDLDHPVAPALLLFAEREQVRAGDPT